MPHLDKTGPEGKGPKTGRKLGFGNENLINDLTKLGTGQGKKRKSGGGTGKGKRLQSGLKE